MFSVLSKYFPEHKLPENVTATSDAKTALLGADYCLHAVPVQVFQAVFVVLIFLVLKPVIDFSFLSNLIVHSAHLLHRVITFVFVFNTRFNIMCVILFSLFFTMQFSATFLEGIAEHVDPGLPFISLSKGLELNTLRMMSQIIPQALNNPRQPFIALSGPSFALELMKKLPTGDLLVYK